MLVIVCVCSRWCGARRPAPGRHQASSWSQTGGKMEGEEFDQVAMWSALLTELMCHRDLDNDVDTGED